MDKSVAEGTKKDVLVASRERPWHFEDGTVNSARKTPRGVFFMDENKNVTRDNYSSVHLHVPVFTSTIKVGLQLLCGRFCNQIFILSRFHFFSIFCSSLLFTHLFFLLVRLISTYCYFLGTRGPGIHQLTPQPPWTYCEIPGDIFT